MKLTLGYLCHLLLWVHSTSAFVKLGNAELRRTYEFGPYRVGTSKHDRSINAIEETPGKNLCLCPSKSSQSTRTLASGLAALIIALNVLTPVQAAAAPTTFVPDTAKPTVELSKGAIVVQTTSDALLKSTIDSKSLLKTLFVNRQELSASLGRIQTTISQEFSNPAWREVQNEFLVVKGDFASSVQIMAPSDFKQTVRDVASGKLNLIVNGELVNVAVQPTFGENQDEVILSIKGMKGTKISPISFSATEESRPRYGPIRSYFSRYEGFWTWWTTPYPTQYLLPNMEASNGDILVAGTAGTIWLIYLTSYMYYEYEKEQEIKLAEAKRQKPSTKPKKKLTPTETKALEEATKINDDAIQVQTNIVNDRDRKDGMASGEEITATTDDMVTSKDITTKANLGELVSPTDKTEFPLIGSLASDSIIAETENPKAHKQLEDRTENNPSRLGWIRFWRRKK